MKNEIQALIEERDALMVAINCCVKRVNEIQEHIDLLVDSLPKIEKKNDMAYDNAIARMG